MDRERSVCHHNLPCAHEPKIVDLQALKTVPVLLLELQELRDPIVGTLYLRTDTKHLCGSLVIVLVKYVKIQNMSDIRCLELVFQGVLTVGFAQLEELDQPRTVHDLEVTYLVAY